MSSTAPYAPVGRASWLNRFGSAERDLVALAIAVAAIVMFVGTGGSVLSKMVAKAAGFGLGPNQLLTNALLLNIALVIFGWRRYDELTTEVAERRKAEAQARLLAETDPLTGCLNRRSITPATNRLIEQAKARGEIAAFLMIDLDNFKQINDCNGHSAGDRLLQECARRIGFHLPEGALLARLGGDEFACVVPFDPRHPDRIDRLANAIIDSIAAPIDLDGLASFVTVSIGLTHSAAAVARGGEANDASHLLHMADIAMYQAKKNGKNRHMWFEGTMASELRYRSELEAGVRQGIARGEFVPYYEQQIDLATGQLVGFEMLARWHSPQFGVVAPDVFIPIAEEIGVIAPLSETLIAQALIDARGWSPALKLSVNISPLQLRDPWFAQRIVKLLVAANFPADRLDIEITETCLHENIAGVHALVTSLKNQGVSMSLDDFGTGYSSLAQLRSLPFDCIKIDRSFITNMPHSTESQTIVQSISALGAGLGLPVVAEGVETQEVLDSLRGLGNFTAQGHLYGLPQPGGVTRDMLGKLGMLAPEGATLAPQKLGGRAGVQAKAGAGDAPGAQQRRTRKRRA